MSRFIKAFIAFSVLLNLALAGLIIGQMSQQLVLPHPHHNWEDIAQSLPQDKRVAFMQAIEAAQQDTGELQQQLSDARKKAANLLKAEPFDKAAYIAQMQEIHRIYGEIRQHMVTAIAGFAEQASHADREMFAEALRHPPHMARDE